MHKLSIIITLLCLILFYGCGEDNKSINKTLNDTIQSVIDNNTDSSLDNTSDEDYDSNSDLNNNDTIDNNDNNSKTDNDTSIPPVENDKPNPVPPYTPDGVCSIILDGNGGKGGDDGYYMYKTMDINNITDLPINNFVNDGYEFTGWAEKSDASLPDYFDGSLFNVTKSVTLYAVWVKKNDTYTITINSQTNSDSMPKKLYVKKGSYIILPPILSNKSGYITIGYSEQNSIMKAELNEGSKFTPKNDTTLYVIYSDGRCIDCAGKTLFVKGVNVNNSDWETKFADREEPPADMPMIYQTAVWNENSNWYSVNQYKYNMCWAATASNMLLWWKHNNKKYIDKYLETNKYEGAAFNYYYDKWYYKGHSDLFDKEYRVYWKNDGNYTTKALDWFLKGDNEHQGGGYFKNVFQDKFFTSIIGETNKTRFNYYLTEVIKNNQIAGLYVRNPGDHIITFWGADYDNDGFIKAIYI